MKTIIAGSRGASMKDVSKALEQVRNSPEKYWKVTEIVSGTARGADKCGEVLAGYYKIPCTKMPANWDLHGKSAGYIRNKAMADYADALIAVWDGVSRGTKNMIDIARKKGMLVFVYKYKE